MARLNELAASEADLLNRVDSALTSALELRKWWLRADATNTYPNKYAEAFVFNRPQDRSFGFIGNAHIGTQQLPINGNVQTVFYDLPKADGARHSSAVNWTKKQIREFVLHYFLRISDYRRPQQYSQVNDNLWFPFLRLFSQCRPSSPDAEGFGFTQLFYKRQDSGQIGRFSAEQRHAIVDVREIGPEYDWILLQNPIFNFDVSIAPFGTDMPHLVVPLSESNFLVVAPEFIIDQQNPEPGVVGRYGVGYAFVRDPGPTTTFAYGPGQLGPAFEQLNWEVRETGEIVARFAFVARQPIRVLSITFDPLGWGLWLARSGSMGLVQNTLASLIERVQSIPRPTLRFDPVFNSVALLNLFTANRAAQQLCISREHVIKQLLFIHFMQHYQTALGSLQTWRQIPDWLNQAELPEWVRTGVTS